MQAWQGRWWTPLAVVAAASSAVASLVPLWWPGMGIALLAALVVIVRAPQRLLRRGAAAVLAGGLFAAHTAVQTHVAPPPLDLPQPRSVPPVQWLYVTTEPVWTPTGHRFEASWLARCPPASEANNALAMSGTPRCSGRYGRLRVDVRGRQVLARLGDQIGVAAFVSPPLAYRNAGALDWTAAWHRQQLWGSIHISDPARMAIHAEATPAVATRVLRAIGHCRRQVALRVGAALPAEPAAVVLAMALGDRSVAWPALDTWLRETGTSHVLAVSGSHLALVAALARWLLRALVRRGAPGLLRRAPLAAWTALPLIAVVWLYTAMTGAASATVRSAWMLTAALAAEAVSWTTDPLELLGFATTLLVLSSPAWVDDLGLQLSVLGVLGLLWASQQSQAIRPRLRPLHALWTATWGAWAMTAPLAVGRMGMLAVGAPLANLVAVPWAALALPASLAAVTAIAAVPPPPWTGWVQMLTRGWVMPLQYLVEHSGGLWPLWRPQGAVAVLGGCALPCFVALWWTRGVPGPRRRAVGRLTVVLLTVLAVAAVVQWRAWHITKGHLRVTLLDVGHGDASVLQFDDGTVWLVDGGGEVGDGGRVGDVAVVPALRALGIRKIDRLVLTHAHPDHENGLLAVARAMPIGSWWYNGQPGGGPEHAALLALLQHVPRLPSVPHRDEQIGSTTVRLLWPDPPPWRSGLGHNDNSLVLLLRHGTTRLLWTGDIEQQAEHALVASGVLPRVDILKVPHHGSRTSSSHAFLDAVAPRLAVVGARPWGQLPFPHADVRARYRLRGVALWASADGAIRMDIGPEGWRAQQLSEVMDRALQWRSAEFERRSQPRLIDGTTAGVTAAAPAHLDGDAGAVLALWAGQKATALDGDLDEHLGGRTTHIGGIRCPIEAVKRMRQRRWRRSRGCRSGPRRAAVGQPQPRRKRQPCQASDEWRPRPTARRILPGHLMAAGSDDHSTEQAIGTQGHRGRTIDGHLPTRCIGIAQDHGSAPRTRRTQQDMGRLVLGQLHGTRPPARRWRYPAPRQL
jgi:competence protein ComEC